MTRAQADVAVFGSLNIDEVIRVARLPAPGETVVASDVARFAGGKGANQAVAAARAGAVVRMAGAVGHDPGGRDLLAALDDAGVDRNAVRTDGKLPTGRAFVLVDDRGENQIIVVAGANVLATPDATEAARVHLCQLETRCGQVEAFLARRPPGSLGILNAAPFYDEALSLFARCDVIIVNETELSGYCRSPLPSSPREAAALATTLLSHAAQRIVVTLGPLGSVTVDRNGSTFAPAEDAHVVDTTAAGDCFCGYLAARLSRDCDFAESIAHAHRAAAIVVGRAGAMSSMPFARELD